MPDHIVTSVKHPVPVLYRYKGTYKGEHYYVPVHEAQAVVDAMDIDRLRVIAEEEIAVTTAGTPVLCPSNDSAKAVIIINNNEDAMVATGLQASVDALADPPIGRLLGYQDATVYYVLANANEIAIDADIDGTKVTVQILGV